MKWKEYALGDVISIKHGFAFKGEYFSKTPTNDLLLTPGNFFIGGGFKGEKFKYYDGDVPPDYVLKAGDVIVTMTDLSKDGDTLGYSAKIPNDTDGKRFLHNQRLGLVRLLSREFDCEFIYWILRSKEYHDFIVASATGSTVKHTSPTRICEFKFLAPEKALQTRIAEILSSLDDKIELNRQMNQTLEEMAQALYKHHFVEGIDPENLPEGWRKGKVEDCFNVTMGQSPDGKSYNEAGNGMVFFQGRSDFTFRFPEVRMFTTEPKRIANPGDTLISVRAPVGDVNISEVECCIGRGLAAVNHKQGAQSFTYYTFKNLKSEFDKYNGEGTVFGSINKDSFLNITLPIPPEEIIRNFEIKSNDLDSLILSLSLEIRNLIDIRNYLLPKLISGEILPKNLKQIEEVL